MANYMKCDVAGCDTIEQADYNTPPGWRTVSWSPQGDEREAALASVGTEVEGPLADVIITRHVVMCPRHELPAFDPEPVRPPLRVSPQRAMLRR